MSFRTDPRQCTRCRETKPRNEFDGDTMYYCKPCRREYRSSEHERKMARSQHLKRQFGMTIDEFEAKSVAQGGRCVICEAIPTVVLRVDHNHNTGAVRGLLCDACNAGIGHFKDNAALLHRAAAYLEEHASVPA